MLENLERAQGLMMAEAVMITLTEKGVGRQEAHEMAREASMDALARRVHYRDALGKHKAISKALGKAGIAKAVDPANYTGPVDAIIDQVGGPVLAAPARRDAPRYRSQISRAL